MLPSESKNTVFCGHRVDPTRDDFYSMDRGPRPGTPQIPQMLENAPQPGMSVGGCKGQPWAPKGGSRGCTTESIHQMHVSRCSVKKDMLTAVPKMHVFVGTVCTLTVSHGEPPRPSPCAD
eukprot:gene15126-biopygen627